MQIPVPVELDITTLTIALTAVYLGSLIFAVLLHVNHRSFPGAGHWIVGQALLAAGALGVALQAIGLHYWLLAASNAAMLAGVVFFGHSIWKFRFGAGFPSWTYAILPVSLAAWFAMRDSEPALRVFVFSAALSVLSALVGTMLLVRKDRNYGSANIVSAIFFIFISGASLLRAAGAAIDRPANMPSGPAAVGAGGYMLALLVAFFNLFGYFLLSSARAEQALRQREQELSGRNEELVETLETKDALIAIIGHDLRSPVWSATRYVRNHLVEFKGDLNTKRESIETLADGLDRLAGLLDSLLEWSLCASGRIKLQAEPLRVEDVVAESVADIATMAAAKNVIVDAATGTGVVAADRRALATVLRNLLSNAVKYSRRGATVRVVIVEAPDAGNGKRVIIAVEDSGVGMKPDQLARLFVPGRTLLTLGTNGEQGHGFGLAISKRFVEAMGASLRVESVMGSGTRFEIDFPDAATSSG